MPNHVKNRLIGPPQALSRLISLESDTCEEEVFGPEGLKFEKVQNPSAGCECVDFSNVIPIPAVMSGQSVPAHVEMAAKYALGLEDRRNNAFLPMNFSDEDFSLFLNYLECYHLCGGLMNWYQWSREMWGTKWNAYEFERLGPEMIQFETAWSAPHPVIERLAEIVKTPFRHEWSDEDTGYNVGWREYAVDGTFVEEELTGTREGLELALVHRPERKELFRWNEVEGKPEYVEPPDEQDTGHCEVE